MVDLTMVSLHTGMAAIRGAVAVARAPKLRVLSFSGGAAAYDTLDDLCTMHLPAREAVACGLWLDEQAHIIADVLLVRGRRDWTVVIDTEVEPVAHAWCHLRTGAHVQELGHAVLEIVGPNAPALMAAAFGPEVAELPLLGWCRLMRGQCARSTKVGEHGFTLILPWEDVARVESTLRARGAEHGLVRAPHEAIEACAIQNGFFRAHAFSEINGLSKMHARGLTPVEAGVQWLTSPDKGFVGCTSLQRQQLVGVRERVVMLATRGSVSVGARVAFAGVDVGEVLAIAPGCSPGADQFVIAFVRSSHAHAGIDGFVLSDDATRALARIMTPPLVIDPRDPFTRESASRIALSAHDLAEISSESA